MAKARRLPFEAVPEVFSRAAALSGGFTADQLRGRRVERLRRGIYADAEAVTDWHRYATAIAGRSAGSALCDVTALRIWRLPLPWSCRADERIHVCVPAPHRPSRRNGVAIHQRILLPGDVAESAGLPVTSMARTFLDLAARAELDELVAVGDAILRTGRCSRERLVERLQVARRQRGLIRAISASELLDPRAQSAPESQLRVRIIAANLPAAQPQCPIVADSGRVIAHVDLGYEEYRVGLEHEGRHHTEARQFAIDTERYTAISAAGWLILRSSAVDLGGGSGRILGKLREALTRRGWQPPG